MTKDSKLGSILGEIAEAEVPAGSLDIVARVRREAAPRAAGVRRPALLRPAMVALGALALLALGTRLLPGQTPTVSAAEALRRAQQVTAFGLSGVSSLHGTLETHAPGSGTLVREQIWIEAPSTLRHETIWPAGPNFPENLQTEIVKGDQAWIWSADKGKQPESVNTIAPAELGNVLYTVPNPTASLDSTGNAMGLCAQPGDTLTLKGQEQLLGRNVLVIDCVMGPADKDNEGSKIEMWIDSQLFLVLKYNYLESNGDVFIESRYTDLQVDPALSDDLFTLPAGVPIEAAPTPEDAPVEPRS